MKRKIIKIDEELCNGCGQCVEGCHEGALQLINGKAALVSELYCDGLGACIGDCPQGAITEEEREAEAYDEKAVMERLLPKGIEVIKAHLKHLNDHGETGLLQEGMEYLVEHNIPIPSFKQEHSEKKACGCPGSKEQVFDLPSNSENVQVKATSTLQQWPVQLHLLSPMASFLKGADLLVAADCCAYTMGNFHADFLKGKRLAIACPKLDSGIDSYIEKITAMIDEGGINTLTVMIMEVPCCSGLLKICQEARKQAKRNIPLKVIQVSLRGEIMKEEWL